MLFENINIILKMSIIRSILLEERTASYSRCVAGLSRLDGYVTRTRQFSRSTLGSWRIMRVSRSPTRAAEVPGPAERPAALSEWRGAAKPRRKSSTARGVCTFVSWRRPTEVVTCARSTPVRWYLSSVVSTYTVSSVISLASPYRNSSVQWPLRRM